MQDADAQQDEAEPTIYYDGSCPLCTAEIRHYASRRGGERLCFVDVSRADAQLGPDLSPQQAMRRFHVRRADGELVSGARAFFAIWHALPGWRRAARIADIPGVTAATELAYRLFLPVRPLLSKLAGRLGARPANPSGPER